MLKAIAAAKKKNDKVDARMIADLLRCNLLPECYMAPVAIRDLRRVLRYRNLVVREATRMKNRIAGLLMETGTAYNKERLHGKAYFSELLGSLQEVPGSVVELLQLSRGQLEVFAAIQRRLLKGLREQADLNQRVMRLRTIPGVGEILALSWALEVGEVRRFPSIGQAASYCGLTSAQHSSAGKEQREPISKQRNHHLQTILIEAAKLAPRHNPQLAAVAPAGTTARKSQPGDAGGSAQAGGISAGRGKERQAICDARQRAGGGMSVWVDFRVLKQSVGIEQVLGFYGVELQRAGHNQLRGRCPLPTHGSQRSGQSFSVDTAKNVWACHSASCSKLRQGRVGGNVLDLVAWLEGCSIQNAALRLQERWWGGRASDHQLLASKGSLRSNPPPLPRLRFSLRLHGHPYLEERGVRPCTSTWFGIGYYPGSGFLHHRVVFPIHDSEGQLVGYAGRSLDGGEPRYLFPPGFRKSQVVFNLHRAVREAAGCAIVVEGFFDCLRIHQAGYHNVVALMGVTLSEVQEQLLLARFPKLVLMLDGDEAGRRASQQLAERLKGKVLLSVVEVPSGRQPDQLSREEMESLLFEASIAPGA